MRKIILLLMFGLLSMASCGGDKASKESLASSDVTKAETDANSNYDLLQGEGKFKDVKVDEKLNIQSADAGSKIFQVKCFTCHKLTNEKLIGPGLLGITTRFQPSWIMNYITNTEAMLKKDPEAQAMLVKCGGVSMPNQNLSDEDARNLLEFMRKNDGIKP